MQTAAYQSLASALQVHISRGRSKFVVTSSGPGEGKSTIAANLGRALARSGRQSVVVLDTDPYKPTIHNIFGIENRKGLGDLIKEVYQVDLGRDHANQFGLGDWVELLRAQTKTGKLTIAQGDQEFSIFFSRGRISSMSGRKREEDGRLGDLLVREGRITEEQKEVALRVQQEGHKRLGDVLHGLGYVEEGDLDEVLQSQLRDSLHRIVTLQRPRYLFSETAQAFLPDTTARFSENADGSGIDHFITGRFGEYLKHPFLSGQIPSYLVETQFENLKVLTSGTVPYDLADNAFALLSERLARSFDVVIMDAPPVALTSPTGMLASMAHGVLFVVKAEGFDLRIVQQAKEQIQKSGANVLGVILNQVDIRHDESLSYYYGAYRR